MNYKVLSIIEKFNELYKDARCSLDYNTPIQLLVSTILAAQCTDIRVNSITEDLFEKYKSVDDFANADISELESDIKLAGFYHNKAKNIIGSSKKILELYGGQVPGNMNDLLTLPGVGRKTANVILGEIFNIPGIIIDTHAKRLSNRIGLSDKTDPEKIEIDLMKIVPKQYWNKFCHQLVFHGRAICKARRPMCNECGIKEFCRFYKEQK